MTSRHDPRLEVLATRGWLSLTPLDFREAILARASFHEFAAGEAVTRIDGPHGGLWGLVEGAVEIELPGPETVPRLGHFGVPGFWFGEGTLIYSSPRRVGAAAACRSVFATVTLADCQMILDADPAGWRWIALQSTINTDLAIRTAADALIRDSEQRTAATLLRLAGLRNGMFLPPFKTPIRLSHEKLGLMAGLSRNAIGPIISRFEECGFLSVNYRAIEIKDAEGLLAVLARERRMSDG